jgi:NADPH:quinone reductase-like Zn-dependent oxidoreductase
MKSVAFASYGPAEVLRFEDRPIPVVAADAVLIRVAAAGVNPADWRLRNGQFKRFMKLSLPFIPGNDIAGTVMQVGTDVTGFQEGDAVFAMTPIRAGGACAEYTAVPAALVAHTPRALSPNEAAALPLAGLTALQGLRDQARLRAGQSLLVIGASGGVGHFAVQIGKAIGASVTALCGVRSFDFVRGLGADCVVDYADPGSFAGPRRYDVVFDTMALTPFTRWRHVLRSGGTLVTVNPVIGIVMPRFVTRMLGVSRLRSFFVEPGRDDLVALRALVEDGKLKPTIQQRFAFERAPEAYRLSEGGHVQGKLIIDVSPFPVR